MPFWKIFIGLVILMGIAGGIYTAEKWVKKPLIIEFPYAPTNWVPPILLSFLSVLVSFSLELCVAYGVCEYFSAACKAEDLFFKALENGLFIPLLCALISKIFGKVVETQNLDYLQLYNEKVSKICFSVLVSSFCATMLIWCFITGNQDDPFYHYLVNRVLMWILSVLGTWVGFGFGCKGRVDEENAEIEKVNKNISSEIKWKFWCPILFCLVLCDGLMVLSLNKMATQAMLVIMIGIMIGIVTLIIWIVSVKKFYISPDKSMASFLKALQQYKANGFGKGQYGRMHYQIQNGSLSIDEMNVIYEGHQKKKDFQKLFGKLTISFMNPDEAFRTLEKRHSEQVAYIKKGYADCIEAEHIKKRKKIK